MGLKLRDKIKSNVNLNDVKRDKMFKNALRDEIIN